jgi:type IV pilus assembly protein PilM
MAHKILGIDLGAYSVKIAELDAGFRHATLVGLYERKLLPAEPDETPLARAARTCKALIDEHELSAEMCATTLGGDAMLRLLTLPLTDRKKIDQVLGYELESQILGNMEDLVVDFVSNQVSGNESHVIAVAAPRADVRARIDALAGAGVEPRVVGAAALSYAALRKRAFDAPASSPPQVIIDFGHKHTLVCIVQGESILFARAIPRGGEEVTLALAEAFKMAPEAADEAKHKQAFVLAAGAVPETPSHRRVDDTVRAALRPLVRELRQTLAAYRAGGGAQPERMLCTGGGARLRGLIEHLEVELGMPAGPLSMPREDPFVSPALRVVGEDREEDDHLGVALPAQALGLALAAAAPVPQVNLRKGAELAYKNDYSYLRGKAAHLAAAVLAVLLFAGINAVASLRGLRKEAEALEFQLKKATIELFGEARLDGKAVSEELRAGPKGGAPPLPALTAYDLLDEISRAVPPNDKGKLDILELDIKPKKTFIKATAESAAQIDDLVAALDKIECFDKVEKGKISSVTSPPSGDNAKGDKPSELKQFSLTIETTCP